MVRPSAASWTALMICTLAAAVCTSGLHGATAPTQVAKVKGSTAAPYGYVESLPSAYDDNPAAKLPLIVFLHGLGEEGAGTDATALMSAICKNSSPNALIAAGGALGTRFNTENCIVLGPQSPNWWDNATLRQFFTYAFAHYPQIDRTRVYLTGLSMGGAGTTAYVAAYGEDIAACIPCSDANSPGDGTKFKNVATWMFHAWNDTTCTDQNSINWCDEISMRVGGLTSWTNVMATYPYGSGLGVAATVETATFDAASKTWSWVSGVDPVSGPSPKLTLYTSGGHAGGWTPTYNNSQVWDWLFRQQLGNLAPVVSAGADQRISLPASASLLATASDDGKPNGTLTFLWDTFSGPGTVTFGAPTAQATSASFSTAGTYVLRFTASDGALSTSSQITVMVAPSGGSISTVLVDLGPHTTTTTGWNNLTTNGTVSACVDSTGAATGMSVSASNFGSGSNGVANSTLYPATAQQDYLCISDNTTVGSVTISGLSPTATYDITLFASRQGDSMAVANYTIGATTLSLNAYNNTANTVTFSSLRAPGGTLTLTVRAPSGSQEADLGVIELTGYLTSGGPANTAPVVGAGANQTITLPATASLLATATDDGLPNGTLTYAWAKVSGPGTVTFSAATAKASTAAFSVAGTYVLSFTANDSALSTTSQVTVTVNPAPNTPPTITALANQSAMAGATVGPLAVTVGDAQTPAAALTLTALSSNAALLPSANIAFGGNGANRTVTLTPATGQSGSTNVTVTVSDGTLNSATQFTCTWNAAPTVATPAAAVPATITGTTAVLSVLGAANAGESTLAYTWTTTGTPPAAVVFTPNGTNAAKGSTATFTRAGSYAIQCTITDKDGLTATSRLTVTVDQTATSVAVYPVAATVHLNGTQQFTASVRDQFGMGLTTQPAITWAPAASPGGTLGSTGLFTANGTASGPSPLTATASGVSGRAMVTVTDAAPTVVVAAAATPQPVTGTTTALSVLGADDAGEASLSYTWATIGTSPAVVTFSANGSHGAQRTIARFTAAGTYRFQVAITDGSHQTVTSEVAVTVLQTPTAMVVAPDPASVQATQDQGFTATVNDQFGLALSTQPACAWQVSGGGTISASGRFTAGDAPGGPFAVTALSGALQGTAQVSVTAGPAGTPADAGGDGGSGRCGLGSAASLMLGVLSLALTSGSRRRRLERSPAGRDG